MSTQHVTWHIDNSIAIVTIDCPNAKVNTLDGALLVALEEVAHALAAETSLTAAVVLSGKTKGFIAGADIKLIESVTDQAVAEAMARRGQQVFQTWADLKIPVIAAINGHCLGGGMEFALACNARIGTPDAQLGLPEVKLGILPGFGGTQRLPLLIGLEKSLEMILTGRTLNAEKSCRLGLLDKISDKNDLREQALTFAKGYPHAPPRTRQIGWRRWLLEGNPLGRALLFKKSREMLAKRTAGHYPAPVRALEVIARTWTMSMAEGLAIEAKALGELAVSPVSKNLIHVYKLSQRSKHIPDLTEQPLEITQATVLGAGTMGSGIAWLLARKGFQVVLKDIAEEAVTGGLERIRGWAGKTGSEEDTTAFANIRGTIDNHDIGDSGMVLEAILENMSIKQKVLQETEHYIGAETIFASNTSSLSITELQSAAERPHNVVGLHFFNPVEYMPLVEIIRGEGSGDRAIATAYSVSQRLGKVPILVSDSPGFLVNRLLVAYLNEACLLVEEGADWQSIDHLASNFGMPMGPFRLIDEVGIDIAHEVGKILCGAFPYLRESVLLKQVEQAGFLGKKNRQGFYQYPEGDKPTINSAINETLPRMQRKAGPADWHRLIMLMVAEASRCLADKVVATAADIDTGMVFGTGFPPFRGGLCRWADQLPLSERQSAVINLAKIHGERFEFSIGYQETLRFYST